MNLKIFYNRIIKIYLFMRSKVRQDYYCEWGNYSVCLKNALPTKQSLVYNRGGFIVLTISCCCSETGNFIS